MASDDVKQEKPKKASTEAKYTIAELVGAAASEFGTTTVVVRAALKKGGKQSYTLKEAKQLIHRMKNKEVKA